MLYTVLLKGGMSFATANDLTETSPRLSLQTKRGRTERVRTEYTFPMADLDDGPYTAHHSVYVSIG